MGTSYPRDLSFLPHYFINHFLFAYLRAPSQVQLAAQRWDEWKEASCQVTSSLAGPFLSAYPATQQVQALELPQPQVDISLDSGGQRAYRCIWGHGKTDVLSRISILREFGKDVQNTSPRVHTPLCFQCLVPFLYAHDHQKEPRTLREVQKEPGYTEQPAAGRRRDPGREVF